jgi:phosphate uptake regulator
MDTSPAARNAAPLTVAAIADRLREGPLASLVDLHVKAEELSQAALQDGENLEQLTEVVRLAQHAMQRFHDFTRALERLVDDLAARHGERH